MPKKKGKGKKAKVRLPSYFDKTGPIWVGEYQFIGKTGDEAKAAFEQKAIELREKLKFERDHSYVCFRVRQLEISQHDMYITVPKSVSIERLQEEIAARIHLGAVLGSDIAIYKPSKALEKSVLFGSTSIVPVLKSSGIGSEDGGGENGDLEDRDRSEDIDYFRDSSLCLMNCFPDVARYLGGRNYFEYDPDASDAETLGKSKSTYSLPSLHSRQSSQRTGGKKVSVKKSVKKKTKTKPQKKTKARSGKLKQLNNAGTETEDSEQSVNDFVPPTPINIYYDIIPYIIKPSGMQVEPVKQDTKVNDALKLNQQSIQPAKTPLLIKEKEMQSKKQAPTVVVPPALPSLPSQAIRVPTTIEGNITVEVACPLLILLPNKPPKLYGLKTVPENLRRPVTAPQTPTIKLIDPGTRSEQKRPTKSAGTMRGAPPQIGGLTPLDRKITPSRPTTAATTRAASSRPTTSFRSIATGESSLMPRKNQEILAVGWEKRWMTSWKRMGGEFEWDKMMSKADEILRQEDSDTLWDSDDESDEPEWTWRLQDGGLSENSIQLRNDARKRIETMTSSEGKNDKKTKGKGKGKSKGKDKGKGKKKK